MICKIKQGTGTWPPLLFPHLGLELSLGGNKLYYHGIYVYNINN